MWQKINPLNFISEVSVSIERFCYILFSNHCRSFSLFQLSFTHLEFISVNCSFEFSIHQKAITFFRVILTKSQ